MRNLYQFIAIVLLGGGFGPTAAAAEGPPAKPDPAQIRARIPQLLVDLDSPRFEVRQRAASEAESWLGRAELSQLLADEFSRRLVDPHLSYEVRWRLECWTERLPRSALPPVGHASSEELDRLIGQLDDDNFAVRRGAVRRIQWLSGNPRLVGPLLVRLKRHLADPTTSDEVRERLEPLRDQLRAAWLATDPAQEELPPVTEQQIRDWVDELARPADGPRSPLRWSTASRELLDTLARDAYVARVSTIVRQRRAQTDDREAAARLDAILDWTRPAMVAEFWQGRRHLGEQHLNVGEPSQAEGATRPSHFDRIDDRSAHCVSGNTLATGDYPSGIAFLHPMHDDAFFHLVNLPTPRRRMAYAYYVRRDEAQRLTDITRRTLDRFESEHRPLSANELKVLENLDLKLVSAFAGRYLAAARPENAASAAAVASLAELVCEQGSAEAGAGLVTAIRRADAERWPLDLRRALWRAGLALAARSPWAQADAWLAGLVPRGEALDEPRGPQLGATAASLLLVRHREPLGKFGLRPTGPLSRSSATDRVPEVQGYRFAAADSAESVQRWWKERTAAGKGK